MASLLSSEHGSDRIQVSLDKANGNSFFAFATYYPTAKVVIIPTQKHTKEEEHHMIQVSYKGFTGELVKLEKTRDPAKEVFLVPSVVGESYSISIYDPETKATHSFADVFPQDVKFLGGATVFGE